LVSRSRPGFLALACIFSLRAGPLARAQEEDRAKTPPGHEGALSNDCFLPSSAQALRDLRAGDQLLDRAREANRGKHAAEARRLLGNAFEHWHGAASNSTRGSSVFTETSAVAVRRVTEGLGHALKRRLSGLDPDERLSWVQRFAPSARSALNRALDRGGSEKELLELQWRHLGTPGAARAAVIACDRALEAGQQVAARAHIARGVWHAVFSDERPVEEALKDRAAFLSSGNEPRNEREARAGWDRARSIEFADSILLVPGRTRPKKRGPGIGVRPGLCFAGEDRLIVQTPYHIHLIRVGKDGDLERERLFEPEKLLRGFEPWLDERLVRPVPPGWSLSPVTDGQALVFVQGRTLGDGDRNGLLCVNLPDTETVTRHNMDAGPALTSLSWAIVGDLHIDRRGVVSEIDQLAALPRLEFQPGPVILGQRVFALGRATEGDVRAWLFAFRKGDGTLLWKRLLAKGADVHPDGGRGRAAASGLYGGASQEILAVTSGQEARLFCGTNLGAGALVDALDGAPLWTLKNRRRDARARGWSGSPALLGSRGSILWPPADSDRLYSLIDGPLTMDGRASARDIAALFRAPIRPLGEAVALLGGDVEECLVLGRARSSRTVSSRRPGLDRIDGLYLAPEETFAGEGLLGEARILFSTNRGLYLFDRERELYLLDYQRIPHFGGGPAGGDVYARDRTVLILGPDVLWAFRIAP